MTRLARFVPFAAALLLAASAPVFAQHVMSSRPESGAGPRPPAIAEQAAAAAEQLPAARQAESEKKVEADSGWHGVIYPLLAWTPIFGASVRLPEVPNPPPCDGCGSGGPIIPEGSTTSGLNGAWFAAVRLEKGKFSLVSDFNWAGLSGSRDRPFLKLNVDMFIWGMAGGYAIAPGLYVEGGARLIALDMGASILVFPEVKWTPDIWQPAVGMTYRPQLGKHWWLFTHADAAGLGLTNNWTATGTARAEWRPARHFALTAGYGFLYLRADGEILAKPVHLSQTLHGPMLGFGIPF